MGWEAATFYLIVSCKLILRYVIHLTVTESAFDSDMFNDILTLRPRAAQYIPIKPRRREVFMPYNSNIHN